MNSSRPIVPILSNDTAVLIAGAICVCILVLACEPEEKQTRSIVLSGGAYVRIPNRQDLQQPTDSTALSALNNDVFSLEIRAAGDTMPTDLWAPPTLFMVSNDQGEDELGIYRVPADSSRIIVYFNNNDIPVSSVPNCDWDNPDRFTQVVVTYDGETIMVFGNGVLLGSAIDTSGLEISDSDALIGADWDTKNDVTSLDNFWYGAIDEVRLWTEVLPASEMKFRYKNPKNLTRHFSVDGLDNLLGLWRFNEDLNDGDTELDQSGNGNDGVIESGAGTFYFSTDGAD